VAGAVQADPARLAGEDRALAARAAGDAVRRRRAHGAIRAAMPRVVLLVEAVVDHAVAVVVEPVAGLRHRLVLRGAGRGAVHALEGARLALALAAGVTGGADAGDAVVGDAVAVVVDAVAGRVGRPRREDRAAILAARHVGVEVLVARVAGARAAFA